MSQEGSRTTSALDPAVLDRLAGLALVARTVVEGYMAGHHRSPHLGSSVDFAQHRPYVPGDELRNVDWKIFARSDRLVVKEFVEETNFSCHLLVDASESMAFGSLGWTKLDYARWCAAAIGHMVIRQRDAAGLVIFSNLDIGSTSDDLPGDLIAQDVPASVADGAVLDLDTGIWIVAGGAALALIAGIMAMLRRE